VEVRFRDGRVLSHQVDNPAGEFDRPYPEPLLREKFIGLTAQDFGSAGAAAAWELARHVGSLKGASELTDGLRALGSSGDPH
jgi:hypothetical protein